MSARGRSPHNTNKREQEGKQVNKYGAIWKELELEIEAESTYKAQQLALPLFQARAGRRKVKGYEITVMLMELDSVEYIHVAS